MVALRRIGRAVAVPLTAVLFALLIGALILALSGANPFFAYRALWEGAFGHTKAFSRTLEKSTPLIFSGLAVAFAFKAGLFNIGGQGQLLFGAMASAIAGFAIDGLPTLIHAPLALLIGAVAGGLYGALAGALKTYTGAHEVIATIMLNYIAINITDYLANGPFKAEGIIARTPEVARSAILPPLGIIPFGFILGLIMAVLVWWLLQKMTIGYEIRTVGQNPHAAKYAGMRVSRTVVLTMFLSGLLAGMGGSVETLGVVGRYQPGFNAGLGFDGITIALLGKTNPFGVIPAAILVGAMRAGASKMQFEAGVSAEIVDVILALMLFFVAADSIVRTLIRVKEEEGERITLGGGWGSK